MSERPPAPPGYRYDFWGRLREDPDYYPPEGFRLARNFFTNRLELAQLFGRGIDWFSDGNASPQPSVPHPQGLGGTVERPVYVMPAPIPPEKIGQGIEWVGPNSNDAALDRKRARDSPHQVSNRDTAAIF